MSGGSNDVISKVFPKAVSAIRSASGLAAYDVNFYKSLDRTISDASESSSNRLLKLIYQVSSSINSQDEDELDGSIGKSWSRMSNLLDSVLERSDFAFDSLQGSSNKKEETHKLTYLDDDSNPNKGNQVAKRQDKPQNNFKTPIDNSEQHPFKPLLTKKPNSITPFEETFVLTAEEENDPSHYKQPYETEIMNQEYNSSILEKKEPIPSTSWQETEPIWVDTVEELQKMHTELKKATEIAVDLEHHDYRSYYGLVCLMQISTRNQDWLIDTLALREDLQLLNSVFTDPNVTKVFHGAFMDIIWLQRDLGLYIVSLFDTYHASRQLGFPKHSLAYLLERFANFKTSKKYQLADWRIRPLTGPMRAYARSDTHFLLNIYDQLRNMLIESNKLTTVLFESRNVAKRRFEYTSFRPKIGNSNVVSPVEKSDPWKSLLYQYNLQTSREHIVHSLYDWRDRTAKENDESPRYIMPNQLLVSLASLAPTDVPSVLSSSNFISDHVRKNAREIADLIKKSLKESEEEDLFLLNNISEPTEKENKITEAQVDFAEQVFNLQFQKSENFSTNASFTTQSQLFSFNNIQPESDNGIVSSVGKNVPSSEIKERIILMHEALPYAYHPEVIQGDSTKTDNHDTNTDKDNDSDDGTQETNVEEADMFKNSDEVVVLKKKQRNKHKKVVNNSEIKKEAFNYDEAEKVMKPKKYEKPSKKRSSSTFDPYSKESEGPKPVKKQQKLQLGKNTSFFSKRKK